MFFLKILLKHLLKRVKNSEEEKIIQTFFAKIIVDQMAAAFQKIKTLPNFINYIRICFLKLDNAISLQQKRQFLQFPDKIPFFAMKIINHHDKLLATSESWDQNCFLSLGLGYQHIQIIGLEFLQRCGHQIRVNTWTGSYVSGYPPHTKL